MTDQIYPAPVGASEVTHREFLFNNVSDRDSLYNLLNELIKNTDEVLKILNSIITTEDSIEDSIKKTYAALDTQIAFLENKIFIKINEILKQIDNTIEKIPTLKPSFWLKIGLSIGIPLAINFISIIMNLSGIRLFYW